MKKREQLETINVIMSLVTVVIMAVTLFFQITNMILLRHVILCALIIVLSICITVLDYELRDSTFVIHFSWILIWGFIFSYNLTKLL